jgi:hypothetical protein
MSFEEQEYSFYAPDNGVVHTPDVEWICPVEGRA